MLHQGSDWFPVTTVWAIVVLASLFISQTFGSFASLTTLSTSSSIANITLVSNSGANYVDSGTNKWYCDNSGILSICVYLRIFNSNCYGKETIEITLQGNRVGGNTDLYSIFSMKNESDTGYNYFTFLSDWSGGVSVGGLSGGVFIAPQCGLSSQLLNTADILDILDGTSNNNRDTVAGGDSANYQRLNDTNIGQSASYFYYRIENNNIGNRLVAYFNAEAINELSCQYGDSFDSDDGNNNDYIIAFLTDNGQVEFSQVDINMTCQDATRTPTGQPTNVPSFTPSSDPTKEPTNKPSMNPSINPTNKPSSNPTIVPTDGPTNDPTNKPSNNPTSNPTDKPTSGPTNRPSNNPTSEPTNRPSSVPTDDPTNVPTSNPIIYPTNGPSNDPTSNPTVSYAPTEGPSEEPSFSTTSNENDELSLINSDDISNYSISVFTTYFYNFIKNNTNNFDTIEEYILLYESAYDLLELYIENNQDSISNDISTLMELADLQEFVIQLLVNYTQMNIETNTNLSSNELFSLLSAMNTITLVPSNLDDLFSQLYSDSNDDSYYLYEIDVLYDVLSLVNNVLTDENLDTLSYDNATILINIIDNIIELASYSSSALEIEYSSTSRDIFGDLIIQDIVDIGVLMLANAMVGEYYLFEIDENTIIKFAKINETIYDECQIYNNLQLSSEILSTKSDNGEYDIDCILMITSNDLYNLSILYDNDDVWVSNFLLVELMTDNYNNINNNDSDTSSATNSGDTTTVTTTTTYLSTCQPIILSYNKTNTSESWWNDRFPLCSYYNETTESYQTDGCYAIYNDDTTVQCACLHLTFYGNTWQEWAPEINYDAVSIFEDVSYDSLMNNPLGLVVTLSWIIIMCLLIFGCKKLETQCHDQCKWVKKDDRPFNQEKGNNSQINNNNNNNNDISKEEYIHHIIYNINNDDRLPSWKKILCLWKLKILNNHLYIGLCCRNHGTNWTTKERILKLMIRVLVTIAVGALFYGIERDTFIGDATLVFWESTFGFWPVFIIIYIFRKMSSDNNNNNNQRNKKAFGYFWVMVFCLLCVIIAAIWCIYFDTFIEFTNSFQSEIDNSECIDNNYIDISAITWSNFNTTQSYIESELSNNYNDWYSYNTNDTSHESMAARFLLSILYCHLVGIIITQPIIAILLALRTFMIHRKKGRNNNNKETLIEINNQITNVNSNTNNGGTAGVELAKSRSNSIVSTSGAGSPTDFEDIDGNGIDHKDLITNGENNNNNNNNNNNDGGGDGAGEDDDDDDDDENGSDNEGAKGETKTGDETNN